jgi:hypothetical protein
LTTCRQLTEQALHSIGGSYDVERQARHERCGSLAGTPRRSGAVIESVARLDVDPARSCTQSISDGQGLGLQPFKCWVALTPRKPGLSRVRPSRRTCRLVHRLPPHSYPNPALQLARWGHNAVTVLPQCCHTASLQVFPRLPV